MPDFNYLYHRHGVSRLRAGNAACVPSRIAHLKLAEGYAEQIALAKAQRAQQPGAQ